MKLELLDLHLYKFMNVGFGTKHPLQIVSQCSYTLYEVTFLFQIYQLKYQLLRLGCVRKMDESF